MPKWPKKDFREVFIEANPHGKNLIVFIGGNPHGKNLYIDVLD
jgi:hypothetical protein